MTRAATSQRRSPEDRGEGLAGPEVEEVFAVESLRQSAIGVLDTRTRPVTDFASCLPMEDRLEAPCSGVYISPSARVICGGDREARELS